MAQQLKNSHKIWKLAKDLGLRPKDDPVSSILQYCQKKVKSYLKDFPECKTLDTLLDFVAAKVNTEFVEIHSADDLKKVRAKYIEKKEKIFATIEEELADFVYGITFKLSNCKKWERQYVSVIDCRGDKLYKAYYTKWHEIAHLLVLTDQTRLSFKRTYHEIDDPEEAMIERIAGTCGFYSPLVRTHITEEMSFEAINSLREQLCPDASLQASLIGFVKAWPKPCILMLCQEALKKNEQEELDAQQNLHFKKAPSPLLRAVKITLSEGARSENFRIHRNMRVPEQSIIHDTFHGNEAHDEAIENLSWWETSSGLRLPETNIKVTVKRYGNSLYALVIPQIIH